MRKFKTRNGTIETEEELRSFYGEEFDRRLRNGDFTQVEDDAEAGQSVQNFERQEGEDSGVSDEIFITPNGSEETGDELIKFYGIDKFNDLQSSGDLKKKSQSGDGGGNTSQSESGDIKLLDPAAAEIFEEEELSEEDYFTGGFGDALRMLDSVSPIGLGDFIDDMARAVAGGVNQGIAGENASDLLLRGSMATEEDILSYIEANKNAQKYGSSLEMQEYQKTYEDNGSGFMGVVMGLSKSGLTILPELIVSSLSSMVSNTDSLAAAGTAIGTGVAAGAVAGGGVLSVPIAAAGAAAALPYAFAAAGSALEMGATFSELLQEEIEGEMTPEKIREVLNDPEKYSSIRNKAVARGIVIGAIDAYTGKLGGKIASKVLTKGGTRAAVNATKKDVIRSVMAAGGVEAVGGSVGEATARLAIGQELDVSEIALEGLAEIPGGIKDFVSTRFAKPKYKVNGEKVDAEVVEELIRTMTLTELVDAGITIDNDYTGLKGKLQDRKIELAIEKALLEANPDMDAATVSEMTRLQVELNKLEGNKTEIGKTKAAELREQIKKLSGEQEVATDVEVESEGPEPVTNQDVMDRMNEISPGKGVYTTTEFNNIKALIEKERLDGMDNTNTDTEVEPAAEFAALPEDKKTGYLDSAGGNIEKAIQLMIDDNQKSDILFDNLDTKQKLDEEETDVDGNPRFSMKDQDESLIVAEDGDVEVIEAEMNEMEAAEVGFTTPSVSSKTQVNPLAESNSSVEFTEADAKELGFESMDDMNREMSYYDGIPMVTGVSDILASGTIKDSKGGSMDVNGGLGFNSRGKNKEAAWAGVARDASESQYKGAVDTYKKNKSLFDRLWKEGKLPNGHVPMAIVRMADTAVNSNEASFRWLAPEVKSQSKKNQTAAMNDIIAALSKDPKANAKTLALIKKNKITQLGAFLDAISTDAKNRAQGVKDTTLSLKNRSAVFNMLVSPAGTKKNSKAFIKSLYKGVKNPNIAAFSADVLYKAIGEPSMMKTKKGDVVSVVGIDVLNGGVIEIDHQNYGSGPKGKLISFIKNPTNGIDVFPTWKAKTNRIFKKDKRGKRPDAEGTADQTMGMAPIDKAFQGDRANTKMTDLDVLSGKLRFAFPGVTVTNTVQEFNEVMNQPGVRTKESNGKIILGLTKDGKIYINPEAASLATPIHEFGHIWMDFLRSPASGKKGKALLAQGLKLVEGTPELKAAIEKYGDTKLAREEALVELMATKGETIINAGKKSKFKEWMNATFKYIQQKFTESKDLDIDNIENLTLDEFIETGLADLFSGKAVDATSKTKFNAAKESTGPMARFELGSSLNDFVKRRRAEGFSDAAIKLSLERQNIAAAEIRAALDVATDSKVEDVMTKVKRSVDRAFADGNPTAKKLKALIARIDKFVRESDAYQEASDAGKRRMEANARALAGVNESRAPSRGRILGAMSDVTNLSVVEKLKLATKIIKLGKEGLKTLSKELKGMLKDVSLTQPQVRAILGKFSRMNPLSEVSVNSFVDYMTRVIKDANYIEQLATAKVKMKLARLQASLKIGVQESLVPDLMRIFSIDPSLIPESVFESYLNLIEQFGNKEKVLSKVDNVVSLKNQVDSILKQLDEQQSMSIELKDKFDNFKKVLDKNGKLDYAATIEAMLKADVITDAEAEVMSKYKSMINPQVGSVKQSEAEISKKKAEVIGLIKLLTNLDKSLSTGYEITKAKEFFKLLKSTDLSSLSLNDLQNLLKVADNINKGYFPHFAQVMIEKMNAINNGNVVANGIFGAKLLPVTKAYSKLKGFFTRKNGVLEMFRRNPLYYTDQLLGDFKTRKVFNALFGPAAIAISRFRAEYKSVQQRVEKAQTAVMKSFGRDINKFVASKYRQMAYMIQLEFDSNPPIEGQKNQVNQSKAFIEATIKKIKQGKTKYNEADIKILEDIIDPANGFLDKDGNISAENLYNSFNDAEKNSIKVIQEINIEQQEKAAITAQVIRGTAFNPLQNYIHLSVIQEQTTGGDVSDLMQGESFVESANNAMNPSTKAKSLISRTGTVSALNFDVYASVERGSKFVLMDYHMTEPIRTARRTLAVTEKLIEDGKATKEQIEIYNAISSAFGEATNNLLENAYTQSSVVDDMMTYLQKTGYRAILAGGGRFIAELTSNLSFAMIVDPKAFISGLKNRAIYGSQTGAKAMQVLGSMQLNRIYPTDDMSGKMVDTNVINEPGGIKGGGAINNKVMNFIMKMWNQTGQRWLKGVEFTADALISTPDKMVMRPMWFGSFEQKFTELTGKAPDFDKIAANDKKYMAANQEALDGSTEYADARSVMAGATDNAFMGMLKGTSKPNQTAAIRAFNQFNNFMTRFLIFEYITARTGVMNLIGRGELSKKQGAQLIAGVTTRMMTYTLLSQVLATALTDLFDDEEDEDNVIGQKLSSTQVNTEEEGSDGKPFEKQLGQALASTFTSLLLGRDFGNATKSIINYAVEEFNESQLQFLRDGDYDPYKDAIQYNIVPKSKQGKGTGIFDFLKKMGAAYGPILGAADLLTTKLTEPDKKEASAVERQQKERYIRLPLEIMGNLGFVPLYKDVRKVVLSDIYGDLSQAEATLKDKRKNKEERLMGYDSESDMKRYDYNLWVQQYGEGSVDFDERQALKEIQKKKRKLKKQMKDEYYDYTPKTKKKRSSGNNFNSKGKDKSGGLFEKKGRGKSSPFGGSNDKKKKSRFN